MAGYARAGLAVFKRDLLIFTSYPFSWVTPILTGMFTVTLFHYISRLVRSEAVGSPDDYYAYVVVGLVILGILTSTLGTPQATLRQELVAGTFERIVLSPLGPVGGVVSMLLFPFVFALTLGLVTLAFAALAFGLPLQYSTIPVGVLAAVLGALAFAPFGLLLAAMVLVFKRATAGATFIISGISLVSGIYFPVTLLPDWLEWLSEVQPFTPAVDLLRHLFVGADSDGSAWLDAAKLLGFTVVLLPAAAWLLGRAVQLSRRRGTIIEY